MGIDMIINFLDDSITRGAGAARPGEEYVDALNEIVMKNGIDMLTFEEEFPVPTTNTGDELTIDGYNLRARDIESSPKKFARTCVLNKANKSDTK